MDGDDETGGMQSPAGLSDKTAECLEQSVLGTRDSLHVRDADLGGPECNKRPDPR